MAYQNQRTRNIDVTRSFVPVDPNAFPENFTVVTAEDSPDKSKPVVAYEGYNFMPTSYGYKSYFGVASELDIDALTSRVDDVVVFQTAYFENILIALCEDGIWTKRADVVGAWTHAVVLDIPEEGTIKNWTHCVISNDFYCYRAQEGVYYKIASLTEYLEFADAGALVSPLVLSFVASGTMAIGTYAYAASVAIAGVWQQGNAFVSITTAALGAISVAFQTIIGQATYRFYRSFNGVVQYYDYTLAVVPTVVETLFIMDNGSITWVTPSTGNTDFPVAYTAGSVQTITPNFLNMAGQQGIFKAGGRLGFWDSENSIAWSNLDDFSDFTPAILTMAGNTIFQEILGKIVTIIGMAEHFVVYSTKSILLITQTESTSQLWNSRLLVKGSGIILPREVCAATPDTKHFAYTSNGLYMIEGGKAEVIVPEVTDFLKESELPVYLKILEGRYLFLGILDGTYVNGLVSTEEFTLPPAAYVFDTPIVDSTVIDEIVIDYTSLCTVLNTVGGGRAPEKNTTDEQQEQAETDRITESSPPKKADTFYKPIWSCFLSKGPVGGNITWTLNPCTATSLGAPVPNYEMSPSDAVFNHTVRPALVAAPAPYVDGNWTIERFIAIQSALWEAEDRARANYIASLTSRVSPTSTSYTNGSSHTGYSNGSLAKPADSLSYCNLGTIVTQFTAPALRIGPCSFSLFRLGIEYNQYNTITSTKHADEPVVTYTIAVDFNISNWTGAILSTFSNVGDATAYIRAVAAAGDKNDFYSPPQITIWEEQSTTTDSAGKITINVLGRNLTTGVTGPVSKATITPTTQERYKSTRFAYNAAVDGDDCLVGDQPYCTITGWEYTDVNGVSRTIPASGCGMTYPKPPPTKDQLNAGGGQPRLNDKDVGSFYDTGSGSICGLDYETVTIPEIQVDPINWYTAPVVAPPTSFLLQDGSVGPIYPTIPGALVYDLQLQKWGKMKQKYKVLVDYMPLNNTSLNIVNYETFGLMGGVVLESGKIALFDENPIDSYMRYGKMGYFREGFTSAEEVRMSFRTPSTGTIHSESSLNGSTIEGGISTVMAYTDATEIVFNPDVSARWHTIIVKGKYDIKHMEFRGTTVGKN